MCEISDVTISTTCMNLICKFALYLISQGLTPAYDIIDENQLSSAHNILSTTKLKGKQHKQPATTIDQNGYCGKLAPIST